MRKKKDVNSIRSIFILSALTSALFSSAYVSSAHASSAEEGFYLSVDAGVSNSSVQRFSRDLSETECDVPQATVTLCDYSTNNSRLAANAGVGYQVGEYFAFELNYYDLVNDRSTLESSASAWVGDDYLTIDLDQTLDLRLRGVGIRAVATVPFNERWSGLLSFGMGRFRHERHEWAEMQMNGTTEPEIVVHQDETQAVPFAGAGLQYRLSDTFDIRAMVNSYALSGGSGASTPFNGRSLTTATLGLVYRF